MIALRAVFITLCLAVISVASVAQDHNLLTLEKASWIWLPTAEGELSANSAGVCFFRADWQLPRDAEITSAEAVLTADNLFVLYVNGQGVGESKATNTAWEIPKRFDISKYLVSGRNVIAIKGANTLPGPAGLLFSAVVRFSDGQVVTLSSNDRWKCTETESPNWQQLAFEDGTWSTARVVGKFGDAPWGIVKASLIVEPDGVVSGAVDQAVLAMLRSADRPGHRVVEQRPTPDFTWPTKILFLADDCSLYITEGATNTSADSLNVTIFNPRRSRAFPEHDLPAPLKVGRKLYALQPGRADNRPRLLLDAGAGGIGSPSVTYDGKSILFAMAREGDAFFHIYRMSAAGDQVQQLTDGPFHDIDPTELPDGRIVFVSTRIGTFEEYHNPPSRSLFVMDSTGKGMAPLTHTLIFDNEPEVLHDGRILFIRSDNFFGRGKVETLLHSIHPDGTNGQTEFGLDLGPEYGDRLRAYYCGSPAPLPDGRVAFLSRSGIRIGPLGGAEDRLQHFAVDAGDVAALPDGRLLCTLAGGITARPSNLADKATGKKELWYNTIGVLDPNVVPATFTTLYQFEGASLHSPLFLGARPKPHSPQQRVDASRGRTANATGFLFCQDVRITQNSTAGWPHIRAVRVLAGQGLTIRSSHSYIVHAGSDVTELGTVPLAPDGSFHVEVPADTPLALQLVDAEGRAELNEMSWIFVRPGEHRSCVGCHQGRDAAPEPVGHAALALRTAPLKLLGQGTPHRYRGNNAAVNGLMELQFDRFREVAGLNRHRVSDAHTEGGDQDMVALIEQLRNGDTDEKISSAQRLAVFRNPMASSELVTSLNDGSREVRVAAAIALASCGSRDAVAPLLTVIKDDDPLVAQAAAMALENLTGCDEPFDAFAVESNKRKEIEQWTAWCADTSWEYKEAKLIDRLQTGDRDAARRAAVALGHIGGEAAARAVQKYVMQHRDENPYPAWHNEGHRGDASRFNAQSAVNPRTLQAAVRSLGYLQPPAALRDLADIIARYGNPENGNLFLAEAAAEALGRLPGVEADVALAELFGRLGPYPEYTRWYGDHDALIACHASPLHYFLIEALDARKSTQAAAVIPQLIQSLPIDPDRALFLANDDYEAIVGRVVRRNGAEAAVVETCLSMLGDGNSPRDKEIEAAIATIYRCWAGEPTPEIRAAQVLSVVCLDPRYEPRVREAFQRYWELPNHIPRLFDTGIPVVTELPAKHWVCFYLARTLGNLACPDSVESLITALEQTPAEAAGGRPDPLGVGVLFLHNELTPCWRAATAWALGQTRDPRAVPTLMGIVTNLDNATDTRHTAAVALCHFRDATVADRVRAIAAEYPEVSTQRALHQTAQEIDRFVPEDVSAWLSR
jgi:HEAT repeat protein